MSSDGCWNCGLQDHHRRDCSAPTLDSAAQIKKESAVDFRFGKKKSGLEKSKIVKKREIMESLPQPVSMMGPFYL